MALLLLNLPHNKEEKIETGKKDTWKIEAQLVNARVVDQRESPAHTKRAICLLCMLLAIRAYIIFMYPDKLCGTSTTASEPRKFV